MNIVATSQITIVDLNDSVFVPNLLPWSKDWVAGSGSLERWTAHGDAAENVRSLFLDPFGYKNILWRCIPDADGGASGGFTIGGIRLNREKTYRFTCFIKRSSTIGGTLTIGMGNVNTLAGVSVSNAPVISFMTAPQADRWYLLVGILHPAGTTSSIGKTGIYDMRGTKLTEDVEYAFGLTSEPSFYVKLDGATTAASEVQLFMPTLECLDGSEESIQTLIRYDGSENDYLRDVLEKGQTVTEGGLLTTNVILAAGLDKVVRSGMSGLASDNIGFFTGGTYEDAVNLRASNIFHKDGSVRIGGGAFAYNKQENKFNLGNFIVLNDEIIGLTDGFERVRVSGNELPAITSIDQGWAYYKTGISREHPVMPDPEEFHTLTSTKWVMADSSGAIDRIKAFSISRNESFVGTKQYRLDGVFMDAWIYNESADESTITATWGLYNTSTGAIVYPSSGPVSVSTPITVSSTGTYKVQINVSPRIKISGVDPFQIYFFQAYFRCSCISQQGVHSRSLIGRDGIMSYYSADSYFYYKEAYGFEARFGGMGFRVSTSGIQKMVDGSTWVNDTLMNTSLASTSALGIMRVGTGLSAIEGLVSIATSGVTNDMLAGGITGSKLTTGYGDTTNPYGSKTAKHFLAAPNSGSGIPSFRAIVASDIPTLNQNTTGQAGSLSRSEGINDAYRSVWFGQDPNNDRLSYDSAFVYNPALKTLQVGSSTVGRIMIGGGMIEWDNTNNALKVIGRDGSTAISLYATGSSSALGIGVGGGGAAYDRLDDWGDYTAEKAGWVLSAALGYDLHGRVSTLESSTPNIAWGVAGSGYIPLAVNGVSHQLSTYGHTHTKSQITDFAHTHDDRYYTETEVNTLLANSSNWNTAYGWGNHASAGYATNSILTSHTGNTSNPHAVTASQVGLGNVENTKLSTWAGSTAVTTLGTVTSGTWSANTIAVTKGGTGKTSVAANSMLYATSSNTYGEVATTAFGRGLLSAVSGTMVTGLNADTLDGLHSHQQRLFNNAGGAAGNNAVALGYASYAGIRTGDATYPYAYIETFSTLPITYNGNNVYGILCEGGSGATYSYVYGGVTYNYTHSGSLDYALVLIEDALFCGTGSLPFDKANLLCDGELWSNGNRIVSAINISGSIWQVVVYSWSGSMNRTFNSYASLYAYKKTNSSNYSGSPSVASGNASVASGIYSVASGLYSVASGNASVASGYYSLASGSYSLASGSYSVASGNYSVASGNASVASGNASVASGFYSVASHDNSINTALYGITGLGAQTVLGKYNAQTSDALVLGWGSSISARSNIFSVSQSGQGVFASTVSATTAILSNLTAGYVPYHTAGGLVNSPITISGNDVSTAGNLTLSSADGSYLQVGGGRLVWDNTNNAIKVIKADGKAANFYATGSNTALGIGTGGGGSSYNMVSNWSQYVAGSELWVVSAELINALRTRVTALEEDTPNVAWGVATTDYVPLTVNAVSRQLSVYGHGHTFASLASKPTTLAGYGITDAMSTSHAANGITSTNISNWSTAYGWGNHASAGYALNSALTSHTGNTSNPHGVTIAQIGAASGSFAYYQFTGATQYSWVRIARLTQDSAYGVISISNNFYNNPPSPVTFSFGVTYRSTQNSFITQIGGSNLHISKARILAPTSFDADYYLEIYTTSQTPYNNGYYISLANSLGTVLYTEYTAGSIPSGYTAREITFRNNGVVSDYFVGALEGNAATATKLETTRALTIGNTAKNFDGSAAVSWSLAEIGAMSASATTDSVNEGTTNYYFTASRVLGVNLSTVTPSNTALSANIPISTAMNRIQGQINARALLAGASTQDFATKNLSVTGTVTATDAIKGSKLYSGYNYTTQTAGFGFGTDGLNNGAVFYTGADTSGRIYRDANVMYFVRGTSATGGFSMNSVGAVTFNQAVETKALLTASGNIATANVDGAYMQIGPIKILYDATNGAIRVEGNIYATGSNTAFGVGGGAGGGGLITNVYGSTGFGGTYSDVDISSTFNAYAINSLYTALQGKQDAITGAISTLVSSNLYPNYALVSGATGKIHASGVTATELSYLIGLSSNIQTQLNAKPSVNSYPTAFSWSAGSTSGPTGTLSGSNMTAVSFGAIPAASLTASGIVTTGSQTFAGAKTFANGIKISSEMAVELLGGAPYLYSNEQGKAIMTFDNGQIKVTHHWESIFEGAVSTGALTASTVSTGPLTASTISTGDVAFKVQKLTRQLSPSDISAGMYQFSGAHANPSKVVFMGCQVYQASNGSLYGDTLSGDGEYFLHPVAAYNNNINVYFESADNSLSADDTLVLFLIYTL